MKHLIHKLFPGVLSLVTAFSVFCGTSLSAIAVGQVEQWNLTGANGIHSAAAEQYGLTGSGVKIAIIDSGINRDHDDLQSVNIETGYNVIDNSTETTDNFGHGTFVAGIIAGNSHNEIGIDGICDDVTIVPIKCFDSTLTNTKNVVSGIYKAVDDYQCDVINLSLGVSMDLPELKEAVDYAASKNVIVVAAVGNNGETQPEQLIYPAAYDSVIGVGAHDKDGNICAFSHTNSSVYVTAPGEDLFSLSANGSTEYSIVSGTSFASAHVAAMAVIAKSYDKSITVEEFKILLANSATDMGAPGYDTSYGYGMVSVTAMIENLQSLPAFRDISDHWAKDNIEYCYEMGLMSGVEDGIFQPDGTLTRAMIVSILWRLDGSPATSGSIAFSDVETGSWYELAVKWAAENAVVSGYGDGLFGPNDNVTREQLATILYGYASYKNMDLTSVTPVGYTDWGQISTYALEPVSWAITNHIISGKTADTVVPQGFATRAEAATLLRNFLAYAS